MSCTRTAAMLSSSARARTNRGCQGSVDAARASKVHSVRPGNACTWVPHLRLAYIYGAAGTTGSPAGSLLAESHIVELALMAAYGNWVCGCVEDIFTALRHTSLIKSVWRRRAYMRSLTRRGRVQLV